MPLFQKYFKVKAKWMGVEKLRRYDLYAPIAESKKEYAYSDAVKLVLDSFHDFDQEMGEMAELIFSSNHYDTEVRVGKQSGAFCYPIEPSLIPWVFQSYHGNPNDVATMAHELGHAVHYLLAADKNILVYHTSLTLAETASTFAEMLLVDRLVASDTDPLVQRDLLFSQLDDAYATIMRQIFFALFERDAHELIHNGGSVDDLTALYLKNLQEQFGDSMDVTEDFKYEWVSIPHIYHTPFYVYAYAFGQLLVLSLYQQYKEEGAPFIERYKKILAAGGSAAPLDVLDEAGINVRTAEFWQGGFDVLAEMLAQLEALPLP